MTFNGNLYGLNGNWYIYPHRRVPVLLRNRWPIYEASHLV